MDIADVRKRVYAALERTKQRDAERRARNDEAARAYSTFLDTIAVPLVRQVANVLRAEGHLFSVFTPSGGVKLASDRHAEDAIELALDTTGDTPLVVARTTRSRGRRVIESERPVGDPASLSDGDLLTFLLTELEQLVAR
jgi:hypothetical protein